VLSDGSAHDCPAAQPFISLGKVAKRLLGNKAYDSTEPRRWLRERGTKCVVPDRSNRKQPYSFSKKAHRERHRTENAFCWPKDFRRTATRYYRLARNFLASVNLVATIVWWIL
jgi:putative transposase